MNKHPSGRIDELDALRGFLAIGVLCYHYLLMGPQMYVKEGTFFSYFPWGTYKMQMFCMISGFVILMSVEKKKSAMDFAVARFSRLYPGIVVAVVMGALLLNTGILPDREVAWPQIWGQLTMLQPWVGVRRIAASYWYLAPELTFYFLMFILLCLRQVRLAEYCGFAALVIIILTQNVYGYWHVPVPDAVAVSRILGWGHAFFAGMLFYGLWAKGESWQRHAGLALCLVTHVLIGESWASVMNLAGAFTVFYLIIYGRLGWIAQKPLLFLGSISYSLYLIHENLGFVLIRYLDGIGANAWVRFFVPVAVALAAAALMTYCIEKPAMQWLRQRYKGRRP